MKSTNILITGGAGNIGSSLVAGLLEFEEYDITVVDNLSTGNFSKIQDYSSSISFFESDVNNYEQLLEIFNQKNYEYVFHLAAVVGVKRTLDNPLKVLNDIDGFKNIFSLSNKFDVKRIFYASSSEVYGEPVEIPLREESSPLNTQLPYAKVKSIGESFCKSYFQEYGLPFTIIRLFNTYGPNQSEDFVIAKFINNALKGETIELYGDGKQTRTFCYVDDTVESIIQMLRQNHSVNEIVNVGSNDEIEIAELAQIIKKLLKSKSVIKNIDPLKEGDMSRRCPDNTKMLKIINRDLISLEKGIKKTAYHKKIFN